MLSGVHGSHMPPSVLLSQPSHAKVVVMIRNPLDAMRSMHTMLRQILGPNAPTMRQMFEGSFKRPGMGWAEFTLEWWKSHQQQPERVLVLFYEDAVHDLLGTIQKVLIDTAD